MRLSRRLAIAGMAALATGAGSGARAAEVEAGKALYAQGHNARGEPVRALVGHPASMIAGARAACAACHGSDARGGAAASDIRWSALVRDNAPARPNGSVRGAYTRRSFAQALNEGVDPSGGRLSPAMPRYSLSSSEIAALAAFLATL